MNIKYTLPTLASLILLTGSPFSWADNPIIKHIYTADPAAAVFNDKVYIYTGHDEASPTDRNYRMDDWHVFSSSDLTTWEDHGEVLSLDDFSWASADAWAGQMIQRGDKYYWYVPVNNDKQGWFGIGVAVSDSPTGPFHDALGHALISDNMTPDETLDIDPTVFIDHDGQAYLYWGNATNNGIVKAVKLKDNMIELDGSIQSIGTDQVPDFTEAPYLHERNGIYYLSYAAGWPERIEYSTATHPMGPFTHKGVILNADDVSSPTSHQSIIEYKNQWYLVYHNADLPDGGEFRRSVAMDKLYYDNNGNIKKVIPTKEGVGTPGIEEGQYVVKNVLSHRCLQPLDGATSDGTQIVQHSCDDSAAQNFTLKHSLDGRYKLVHQQSGKLLDISRGSAANGANAILWSDYDGPNQFWNLTRERDNSPLFSIENDHSQRLLESLNASTEQDAKVGQWQDNGGNQQRWWLAKPGAIQIEPIAYPDRVLTYRANGVWMEETPAPLSSSQFKPVPGLYDSTGVSFESVTHPGYYLRHRNYTLYMEYNNHKGTFAQDATFYRRSGLSDSKGVSYESSNFPNYYIRHEYYKLRIDPIESQLDRTDATFLEVSPLK
ncbi:family 43 glycosylhydrolase [Vibrio mangrovi]|uniref:Family 43 glycosylhydrolase n=1 Tax=Vibrio mangrovi TaxID=474394 RepID=A0A1Y6J1F1_9VIBR|nr:family 43 glycosylhydrolase [Vibrio mangrovi]MDW6005284.1 family 43 glycosylhydrolase [Vibrio mangrovi]SMS02910.1 Xylosidase/arabinosidase [Vibrio mangrovi]